MRRRISGPKSSERILLRGAEEGTARSVVEEAIVRAPRVIVDRARSLRRDMSLPEVLLWQALRRGQLDGLLFRRQHPIDPYVLDFYCPAARLAIEVDGSAHDGVAQAAHDIRRDLWLADHGIRVMRFPAREMLSMEGRHAVLATIEAEHSKRVY